MNVLFKHRYFRRECMGHTWEPSRLVQHLPAGVWCFDYVNHIEDFTIIWKLCEIGDLKNLKKVRKSTRYKFVNIEYWFSGNKLIYNNSYCRHKIINIELIVSCFYGHIPVVQYLRKQGADIYRGGGIVLQWSARGGHLPMVQYLVEQGIIVYENDYALLWSSEKGHLSVVQYLVKQGANIHAHNDLALQWSAENGHLPVVQYLVEQGADIHVRHNSALRYAFLREKWEVVQYLIKKGANKSFLAPKQLKKLNSLTSK